MEKITFLVAVFSISLMSFGQNSILGLSRSGENSEIYLANINASSGEVNDISPASTSTNIENLSFTVDPDQDIYYYASDNKLIGVDTNTGLVVSQPTISTPTSERFVKFKYNEVTQEIYGLETGANGVYLAKINPTNGNVTTISNASIADFISFNGETTLDLANQLFYFVSEGKLISVDLVTGQIVNDPIIDTTEIAYFDNIIYNVYDSNFYGIGRNPSPAETFLGTIDPMTGEVTIISQASLGNVFNLSGAMINPFSNTYHYMKNDEFMGVDINTGEEVTSPDLSFTNSNGEYFEHFYLGIQTETLLSNQNIDDPVNLEIYPNPTQDFITINAQSLTQISLFDLTGKQVFSKKTDSINEFRLDLIDKVSGVYLLKIETLNGESSVRKIIKK
ncbi:T9SS type A sorting domain-containing protein [Psychroflexus aestuariivivens]|uniref:T9SS type A sorting domain-containing protein n=1 Tax=Psychroflexus aestuariivivens TaxID=1795040 RepID=UPI000FDC4B7C|nr:T9SS type A sorting domain-containing protein [Psychroflexus aestuariivivens]